MKQITQQTEHWWNFCFECLWMSINNVFFSTVRVVIHTPQALFVWISSCSYLNFTQLYISSCCKEPPHTFQWSSHSVLCSVGESMCCFDPLPWLEKWHWARTSGAHSWKWARTHWTFVLRCLWGQAEVLWNHRTKLGHMCTGLHTKETPHSCVCTFWRGIA